MEPHPVPQNILDVEFKLFGAFTLKQFGKIMIGSLVGVGIFLININPIIKIPLVLASVFIGILSAIIPNFQTSLFGFIKALFISPRYVWVKENQTPEILAPAKMADPNKDRNVTSALNKKKLDINELPLDKLFGTTTQKSTPETEEDYQTTEGQNLSQMYSDVFGDVKKTVVVPRPAAQASMANVIQPVPAQSAFAPRFKSIEEYQKEINKLKFELSSLAKDPDYKDKEQKIMEEINDLFAEIKLIQGEQKERVNPAVAAKAEAMELDGRLIFGIVVDKRDQPVAGAHVDFLNMGTNQTYSAISSADGKFTSNEALPKGEYAVTILYPSKRFHAYKIVIADQPLPGYKLREK